MENSDKKEGGYVCQNCGHSGCCGSMCEMHGCHGGRHHLVRMILKITIVIIIFWCGFKLGEMSGFIRAEYGGGINRELGGSFGMMRGGWNDYYNNMPTTVAPATPAPTPAK